MEDTKREKLANYMTRLADAVIKLEDLCDEADDDKDICIRPMRASAATEKYSYQISHEGFAEFIREFKLAYSTRYVYYESQNRICSFRWAGVCFYALFNPEEYKEAFKK